MQTSDETTYLSPTTGSSESKSPYEDILSPENMARVVYEAILSCATTLRPDVLNAIKAAYSEACSHGKNETRAAGILSQMIENAQIAENDRVPLARIPA